MSRNRYSSLEIPRNQCNNPSAAQASEVAHEMRALIPRVPRNAQNSLRQGIRESLRPHRPRKGKK